MESNRIPSSRSVPQIQLWTVLAGVMRNRGVRQIEIETITVNETEHLAGPGFARISAERYLGPMYVALN
jgi:hypothetical protein